MRLNYFLPHFPVPADQDFILMDLSIKLTRQLISKQKQITVKTVKVTIAPKLLLEPSERNTVLWCSTTDCYTKIIALTEYSWIQ